MNIETRVVGNFVFYSVGQKTEHPVNTVLSFLEMEAKPKAGVSRIIDFSSLKRSRFTEGSLDKLFENMPKCAKHLFVFPGKMLPDAEKVARNYGYQHNILTKKTATMLASLSGAYSNPFG
ncbi:hypothetical protein J4430_04125 [Candidatus Woesearchaeota archaeon]|nr:hypothetical protein [Candidatus Woesearchaeota archaeon]